MQMLLTYGQHTLWVSTPVRTSPPASCPVRDCSAQTPKQWRISGGRGMMTQKLLEKQGISFWKWIHSYISRSIRSKLCAMSLQWMAFIHLHPRQYQNRTRNSPQNAFANGKTHWSLTCDTWSFNYLPVLNAWFIINTRCTFLPSCSLIAAMAMD